MELPAKNLPPHAQAANLHDFQLLGFDFRIFRRACTKNCHSVRSEESAFAFLQRIKLIKDSIHSRKSGRKRGVPQVRRLNRSLKPAFSIVIPFNVLSA
jgi:hypothetical protein